MLTERRGGRRRGAGRPPKPSSEKQSAQVTLTFTLAEHRALRRAAGKADLPVASFGRELVLRGLRRSR